MKRTFVVVALICLTVMGMVSCTTQKGGCKSVQGYVGYGSR